MPTGEDVATLGRTGATLAIHLSIMNLGQSPFGESYLYSTARDRTDTSEK
jgi:hypothetical protein